MANHVTSCLNVLEPNYIDSKNSAVSWNTNIYELGTIRGSISMLRPLKKKIENINHKRWGSFSVQYVTSPTFEKIDK